MLNIDDVYETMILAREIFNSILIFSSSASGGAAYARAAEIRKVIDDLDENQKKILQLYDFYDIMTEGIKNIKYSKDPGLHDIVNHSKEKAESIARILKVLYERKGKWPISDEEEILHITFQLGSEIQDIVKLKAQSESWYDIGRGFALAAKSSPEEIRVVSARSGSIVIDLAAAGAVVVAIAHAVKKILEQLKKYHEIRKLQQEVVRLQLQNTKIAIDLANETENHTDVRAEEITDYILNEHFAYKEADGEVKNALTKAINKLAKFIREGGGVSHTPMIGRKVSKSQSELKKVFWDAEAAQREIKEVMMIEKKAEEGRAP